MKKYTLVERGKALRDLHEIINYLVDAGATSTARRFADKVHETYERLVQNPHLGSLYLSDNPILSSLRHCRVRGFKKYVVFYAVVEAAKKIRIVRVLHGSRNVNAILDADASLDDE